MVPQSARDRDDSTIDVLAVREELLHDFLRKLEPVRYLEVLIENHDYHRVVIAVSDRTQVAAFRRRRQTHRFDLESLARGRQHVPTFVAERPTCTVEMLRDYRLCNVADGIVVGSDD